MTTAELIREAREWLERFRNLKRGGYKRDFALAWTGGTCITTEDLIGSLADALERAEKERDEAMSRHDYRAREWVEAAVGRDRLRAENERLREALEIVSECEGLCSECPEMIRAALRVDDPDEADLRREAEMPC